MVDRAGFLRVAIVWVSVLGAGVLAFFLLVLSPFIWTLLAWAAVLGGAGLAAIRWRAFGTTLAAWTLALCCGGWAIAEVIMAQRYRPVVPTTAEPSRPSLPPKAMSMLDDETGWTLRPNVKVEDLQYSPAPPYTIDAAGMRRVPDRPEAGPAVYLYGGSYTFGQGLPDEQTIAAQLQQVAGAWRVYNGGVCGYGACQSLCRMRRYDPAEATVVYLFIPPHMARDGVLEEWRAVCPDAPVFRLRDSKLVRGEAESERSHLARQVSRPARLADAAELTLAAIRAMRREAGRFLLVRFPCNSIREYEPHAERIVATCRAEGMAVLDLHAGPFPMESLYDHTSHPTAELARWAARRLHEHLAAMP